MPLAPDSMRGLLDDLNNLLGVNGIHSAFILLLLPSSDGMADDDIIVMRCLFASLLLLRTMKPPVRRAAATRFMLTHSFDMCEKWYGGKAVDT